MSAEPLSPTEEAEDAAAASSWSPELVERLLRVTEGEVLWRWLQHEERATLLREIARGFQISQRILRQPLVRKRLLQHLVREDKNRASLFEAWCETPRAKTAIEAIGALPDEEAWHEHFAELTKTHGADTIQLLTHDDPRFAPSDEEKRALDVTADEATATQLEVRIDERKEREIEQLREQLTAMRARAREAESALSQSKKEVQRLGAAAERTQQEQEQHERHVQRREAEATARAEAASELLNRTQRRLKQLEKENEELHAETKRLQRVVRQSQRAAEEGRKQIAQLSNQLIERDARLKELEQEGNNDAKTPPKSKVTQTRSALIAKPKTQLPPEEQIFIWNADGREMKVTPREVKEAIERNDEARVYGLVQALDALRESDTELYRKFLNSVRELKREYARVLTVPTMRVLVDASNVARYQKDSRGRGQLRNLLALRDELLRHDCFPVVMVADASLPHNIDEPAEMMKMAARGEIEIVAPGTEADDVLARESRRTGAFVVTNDRNFHGKIAPNWEPPRIHFSVREGVVTLSDF